MSSETPSAPKSSAPTRRRLGRGLASLMANTRTQVSQGASPSDSATLDTRYQSDGAQPPRGAGGYASDRKASLPIASIQPNPHQPRRTFAEADLEQLAESIRLQGVLQPLLVSPAGSNGSGRYVLVAGERRLRAAQAAGLEQVPCVIRTATAEQMLEWALIENVQRSDLNPFEQASAYRDYMARFGATQQQVARQVGLPRSTIANYLRIIDLCDEVQQLIADGSLSFGHAKVLGAFVGDPARQIELANKAAESGLSVRHLEQLAAVARGGDKARPPKAAPAANSQYIRDVERQLSQAVGTRVCVKPGRGKNTGRIIVDYYSLDDFDRIAEALGVKIQS